jgi:hypothetical protein
MEQNVRHLSNVPNLLIPFEDFSMDDTISIEVLTIPDTTQLMIDFVGKWSFVPAKASYIDWTVSVTISKA